MRLGAERDEIGLLRFFTLRKATHSNCFCLVPVLATETYRVAVVDSKAGLNKCAIETGFH